MHIAMGVVESARRCRCRSRIINIAFNVISGGRQNGGRGPRPAFEGPVVIDSTSD